MVIDISRNARQASIPPLCLNKFQCPAVDLIRSSTTFAHFLALVSSFNVELSALSFIIISVLFYLQGYVTFVVLSIPQWFSFFYVSFNNFRLFYFTKAVGMGIYAINRCKIVFCNALLDTATSHVK